MSTVYRCRKQPTYARHHSQLGAVAYASLAVACHALLWWGLFWTVSLSP